MRFPRDIYLNHLGQPERAMDIVRGTHSARAAQMVATHCNTTGNYAGAIEFLLMAKRQSEAFELAKTYDGMDVYVEKLGKNGKAENYVQIARYFEQKRDWGRAAHFYSMCCQYHKALKFYLNCGETYIDKAIALVGEAQSDMLTHTLIDFLSGDTDGVPKDNNYVYRLYMALGKYAQAAKTAVIIAKQEQDLGNYRYARQVLYQTQRELVQMNMNVPKNLRQSFSLIHSYLLVKGLAKSGDHLNAARMLIRVANNISKFPAHDASILTSCVIECQRSGLKAMAFKYASKLIMEPELREKINPKFKRKIEQIVRGVLALSIISLFRVSAMSLKLQEYHSYGSLIYRVRKFRHCKDDVTECETTPSPYAPQREVPVVDLVCPVTKNDLPWCVVSGYHMNLSDWCVCPNSKLPALYSKYKEYIQRGANVDPVLGKPIRASDLILVEDPKSLLKSFDGSTGDRATKKTEEGDDEKNKIEDTKKAFGGSYDNKELISRDGVDREPSKQI